MKIGLVDHDSYVMGEAGIKVVVVVVEVLIAVVVVVEKQCW